MSRVSRVGFLLIAAMAAICAYPELKMGAGTCGTPASTAGGSGGGGGAPDPCAGNTCSGHGTCSAGACTCNTGYAGTSCNQCASGYDGYPTCTAACAGNCSGHGTCSGGVCTCRAGYTGTSCSQCASGYGGYPTCTTACAGNCSGHGTCSGGVCICNTGYTGTSCSQCTSGSDGGPGCCPGPGGWCWWKFANGSTTAAWVAPLSASSAHAILTTDGSDNAGIGLNLLAITDLSGFTQIQFTAVASAGFEFCASSDHDGTAGCCLNFLASRTKQLYTFDFSKCPPYHRDAGTPNFTFASVDNIHWDTVWNVSAQLDIEIVPPISFCNAQGCAISP